MEQSLQPKLDEWRIALSQTSKNGVGFILAGSCIWAIATGIWLLPYSAYYRAVLVLFATGLMFPLAILMSNLIKADWRAKANPLGKLALWCNLASYLYYPMLIIILLRYPDEFISIYAIIVGAHFFPFAWVYKAGGYAIASGTIVAGIIALSLLLPFESYYLIPLYTCVSLILLAILLSRDVHRKNDQ